jgi:predicted DNA-binding protein (MmcQ/YjbR family)
METDSLTQYCLSKRGAVKEFPFGPDTAVFKAGSKMFAILSERNDPQQISLKCDPVLAENLRQQNPSVIPGYHLNKTHWNTVILDGSIPEPELQAMIDHSYELILKSLTKAERSEILQK